MRVRKEDACERNRCGSLRTRQESWIGIIRHEGSKPKHTLASRAKTSFTNGALSATPEALKSSQENIPAAGTDHVASFSVLQFPRLLLLPPVLPRCVAQAATKKSRFSRYDWATEARCAAHAGARPPAPRLLLPPFSSSLWGDDADDFDDGNEESAQASSKPATRPCDRPHACKLVAYFGVGCTHMGIAKGKRKAANAQTTTKVMEIEALETRTAGTLLP